MRVVALIGWLLFAGMCFWHFVMTPIHQQLTILTNAMQQVIKQQQPKTPE